MHDATHDGALVLIYRLDASLSVISAPGGNPRLSEKVREAG